MAETKKPANTTKKASAKAAPLYVPTAAEKSKATGLRIGAVLLWIVAIGAEVMALLTVIKKVFTGLTPTWRIIVMIGFLVLDLAALIIGSALWKKSNKLDPASEKNKVKFWLWNNLGVVVAAFAFIPFIIIVLLNKDTDKKTKAIAAVVAVIALLIGGISSYDFDPISSEAKAAAAQHITGTVYTAPSGQKYHTRKDCQAFSNTKPENIKDWANVTECIDSGYETLCKFCARNDNLYGYGINIEGGDIKADDTAAITDAADTTQNTTVESDTTTEG